jgi:hypothetical protein
MTDYTPCWHSFFWAPFGSKENDILFAYFAGYTASMRIHPLRMGKVLMFLGYTSYPINSYGSYLVN